MSFLLKLTRRIFSKEQRRFIKFCLVGASGVPVNLLVTWLAYAIFFATCGDATRKALSSLLGIVVSIFTNFLLNDYWTWKDRKTIHSRLIKRLAKFYFVSSLSSAIQFGTAVSLMRWQDFHILLAQLVGIALATMVNYLVNNFWTFRARPSASPAEGEDDVALPAFIEVAIQENDQTPAEAPRPICADKDNSPIRNSRPS